MKQNKIKKMALAAYLVAGLSGSWGAFAQEKLPDPEKLKKGQNISHIQSARIIQRFMNDDTVDCVDKACTKKARIFDDEGRMNYGYVAGKANKVMGTNAQILASDAESSSVASQVGKQALLCADPNGRVDPAFDRPVIVAGVAFKPIECSADENGNATVRFRICTAPAFGKPITNSPNAVPCSDDPKAPNYTAPAGYVCASKACDSEPEGSEFGWSAEQVATRVAGSADDNNGRALVFYPSLGGGGDYTSDAETLSVVKIVDTYAKDGQQAIGMRMALRYKRQVTKETLRGEGSPVTDPEEHTAQWRAVQALNNNDRLSQETATQGGRGAACIKNVVNGLASDGQISICDENHNQEGARPMAVSAQVVTDAADCTTVSKCVSELVETKTWTETCSSPVTISTKICKTTTAWQLYQQYDDSRRLLAQCSETRNTSKPTCSISAATPSCRMIPYNPPLATGRTVCVPNEPVPPATQSVGCTNKWEAYDPPPPTHYQVCDAPKVTDTCSAYK